MRKTNLVYSLFLPVFLLLGHAQSQPAPQILPSYTKEDLRGVSAVSQKIAWASGTHGTYLRTTDGRIWIPDHVPGAETLDFRAVVAFSADEAFLMSAGTGELSRIYHTTDAGRHWQLQYTNHNLKGFFDSMIFWDRSHGIVLGDPVMDDTGKLKFELLATEDGQNWQAVPSAQLPPAIEGEGAFAASNSCLAILKPSGGSATTLETPRTEPSSTLDPNLWFATGGKAARVFHSPDRGRTWQVFETPIGHGPESAGIFSIAFRDAMHGVISGGDYRHPNQDGPNLAFTSDGGKSWTLSKIFPQSYYSAVAYDRRYNDQNGGLPMARNRDLNENQTKDRIFIIGPGFIYDFRPPRNPTRVSPGKKSERQFNAVSPYPEGGILVVGPKGTIANVP